MANRISKYYDEHGRFLPTVKQRRAQFASETSEEVTARQGVDRFMQRWEQELAPVYAQVCDIDIEKAKAMVYSFHHGEARSDKPYTFIVEGDEDHADEECEIQEYDVLGIDLQAADRVYKVLSGRKDRSSLDQKLRIFLKCVTRVRSTGLVVWRLFSDSLAHGDSGCSICLCGLDEDNLSVAALSGLTVSTSVLVVAAGAGLLQHSGKVS